MIEIPTLLIAISWPQSSKVGLAVNSVNSFGGALGNSHMTRVIERPVEVA